MKASGLKGVVISHGLFDGLGTIDMSVELAATLTLTGIPTEVYGLLTKTPGTDSGTTLDSDVLGFLPGYESPFAGHVAQLVTSTAVDRLAEIYAGAPGPSGFTHVTLVDGQLGQFPLF